MIKLLLVYQENAKNNRILNDRIKYGRDYYKELIKCIESWRKNGGKYKDIDVVIFSDVQIKDLNFNNIKWYKMDFNKLDSKYGFVNVHIAGLEAHKIYPQTRFIHIDLDMYLQRELPDNIFNIKETIIGVYSCEDEPKQRKKIFGERLVETDFIVSSTPHFYKNYLKYYDFVRLKLKNKVDEYDIEEYVADFIQSKFNYKIFERYEIGEGFYNIIQNPYFLHYHLKKKELYK